MRVLMTGNWGFLGSVFMPEFQKAGFEIVGLDTGFFEVCTLVPDKVQVSTIRKDIRDLASSDVEGFDAIVHLAALSNDPIGNLKSHWTEEINFQASVRLAELAKAAGVTRFLFSSSCIMYGQSEATEVTEESALDPKTEYARSKVKSEKAISQLANETFSPTFMRNGTIYGVSPRMRFDTVFNNLMGSAMAMGKVVVQSDGRPWRPVIHIQDVARAFIKVLEAPISKIHNQAFNVGADHLNHQVIELAETAVKAVPGCKLEVVAQPGADQRTYKASFKKIAQAFPDFKFKWTIKEGAEELYETFKKLELRPDTFTDKRFTRLKWLNHLLDTGKLDNSLRWNQS